MLPGHLHQFWDQIMAADELNGHIAPGRGDACAITHQKVVGDDGPCAERGAHHREWDDHDGGVAVTASPACRIYARPRLTPDPAQSTLAWPARPARRPRRRGASAGAAGALCAAE